MRGSAQGSASNEKPCCQTKITQGDEQSTLEDTVPIHIGIFRVYRKHNATSLTVLGIWTTVGAKGVVLG